MEKEKRKVERKLEEMGLEEEEKEREMKMYRRRLRSNICHGSGVNLIPLHTIE